MGAKTHKSLKIVVAEDDFVVAKNLSISLEEAGYEVVASKETGEELLDYLQEQKPDLVILDINLAGLIDGIAVAHQLKEKGDIPFLFLTSDRDRSTLEKAKLTQPSGYLIKPFDTDELVSAIELAVYNKNIQQATPAAPTSHSEALMHDSYLFVKSKNRLEKVRYDDILFVEANDIYATLTTQQQTFILSYPLKTLESKFPSDRLMRVHRSYIVNLDHIDAIEDNYIQIKNKNIPIGKTHKEELMRRLSII